MSYDLFFRPFPVLYTNRLVLRALEMSDAQDIFNYASRPEVTTYVSWDYYRTLEDAKVYLRWMMDRYRKRIGLTFGVVLRDTGRLIGTCSYTIMDFQNRSAEIGYTISPEYWNRGLMTEAAAALIQFGFDRIKLVRIQSRCATQNKASARVIEKLGMCYEGTQRKGVIIHNVPHNVLFYAMTDEDYRALCTHS